MKLISLIMALLLPVAALADHADNRWTLGLGAGMSVPLNNSNFKESLDSDLAGSVWARYNLTHRWGLQLGYDRVEYNDAHDSGNFDTAAMDNFSLMATLNFGHMGAFTPYVGAGLGYGIISRFQRTSDDSAKRWNEITPKVRLGLDWALSNSMSVGLMVDWHYFQTESDEVLKVATQDGTGLVDDPVNNAQTLVPMLSFSYSFGPRHSAPKDSDSDGVNDKNDSCPNTPAGTTVDSTGCKVKASDSDGDGVADADDKCANTPAGKDVNAYGCAAAEVFSVKMDVKFDSGKSVVKAAFHDQIAKVGDFMKEHKGTSTEIEGHTDNTGKKSYNVWLSKKRAEAIRKYIIKNFGIEATRLTAVGYGPDQPISDNKTRAGRAENRRVVASIKTEK